MLQLLEQIREVALPSVESKTGHLPGTPQFRKGLRAFLRRAGAGLLLTLGLHGGENSWARLSRVGEYRDGLWTVAERGARSNTFRLRMVRRDGPTRLGTDTSLACGRSRSDAGAGAGRQRAHLSRAGCQPAEAPVLPAAPRSGRAPIPIPIAVPEPMPSPVKAAAARPSSSGSWAAAGGTAAAPPTTSRPCALAAPLSPNSSKIPLFSLFLTRCQYQLW